MSATDDAADTPSGLIALWAGALTINGRMCMEDGATRAFMGGIHIGAATITATIRRITTTRFITDGRITRGRRRSRTDGAGAVRRGMGTTEHIFSRIPYIPTRRFGSRTI